MAFQYQNFTVDSAIMQCHYEPQCKPYITNELRNVIMKYPSLAAKPTPLMVGNQTFTFICLDGTLPIPFKQNYYNIPVRIIYPNQYPHYAPLVRVIPSAEMVIKPSEYIDDDGNVKLDLFRSWNYQRNTFNIIDEVVRAFSTKMPVFRKSNNPSNASPAQPNINPPPQSSRIVQEPQNISQPAGNLPQATLQKLNDTYRKVIKELTTEIDELNIENTNLDKMKNDIVATGSHASQELTSNFKEGQIRGEINRINDWIFEANNFSTESWKAEDYLEFNNQYASQYLQAKSEELAYGELINNIVSGFNSGVIQAQDMVKCIKDLSTKQFMATRLKEKIMKAGGIAG